jgi:hypothetical protein
MWIREEEAEHKQCPFKEWHCITCGCMGWQYCSEAGKEEYGRCQLIPE